MAAPIAEHCLRKNLTFCRFFAQRCSNYMTNSRTKVTMTDSEKPTTPSIAVSDDGGTIYCWHPEGTIPYEHTKPLVRKESDIREGDSALKVQLHHDDKNRYEPDGPRIFELMNMFNTTKHRWYPPGRKVKNRQAPFPRSRESL